MLSKHQGTGGVTGILQTVHTPAEQRVRGWSPLGVALKVPENSIHFHQGERPPTELALEPLDEPYGRWILLGTIGDAVRRDAGPSH
jgi:hypothetical protein